RGRRWGRRGSRGPRDRGTVANARASGRRPPRHQRCPPGSVGGCAGGGETMTGVALVFLTTFLASAVEAIEMVTIVVGVGVTRGWRSTLAGTAAGFVILALTVVGLG